MTNLFHLIDSLQNKKDYIDIRHASSNITYKLLLKKSLDVFKGIHRKINYIKDLKERKPEVVQRMVYKEIDMPRLKAFRIVEPKSEYFVARINTVKSLNRII